MLKTRIITATVLLAGLLLALFFLPPLPWAGFCSLICALAAWEWGALAGFGSKLRVVYGIALGCLCLYLLLLASDYFSQPGFQVFGSVFFSVTWFAIGIFWLLIVPFWLRHKWLLNSRPWCAALIGIIVLVPPMFVFFMLRYSTGPWGVLAVCALVWVADIAAYFSGRAFGGKKLAPSISPGKTWAGAIGGMVGVLLYCNAVFVSLFSFGWYAAKGVSTWWALLILQFLFMSLATLSIVGDLFESLLKRQAGMKDSSNLLPGHGGVLDRVDSLVSTLGFIGFISEVHWFFLFYFFS
ncbi:MAG: phosphatidate cytidylyltransferase [Azoarcus sp.]|jgi:phosphatidate cytidylyltransferase|nr:phosphatidate cytidylyltransferase [Azoarcus sp.]